MSVCCRSLLLGLAITLCLQFYVEGQNANMPQKCCVNFYTRRIPVSAIVKYRETRADCAKRGVIFTTKKKLEVCVDPKYDWVKRIMENLDMQQFVSV